MKKTLGPMMCHPAVCVVEKNYVIAVPVRVSALIHIEVGGKKYFCHANGVRVSNARVQMFTIPQRELDGAGEYTVVCRRVFCRLPFNCILGHERRWVYSFHPVRKTEGIKICHISDTHGLRDAAVSSGRYFGEELDLLLLNGDIQDFSATESQLMLPYKIASDITGGRIPVILSRGNHDLRGAAAERLSKLYPCANGRSYYYAHVGCMCFLLLDCGEDKEDGHREYGSTAAFHPFRLEQTAYLEDLAREEHLLEGIKYRFILSHIPFAIRNTEDYGRDRRPFDIENEIYDRWCAVLNQKIRPQLLIGGHYHETELVRQDAERNTRRICCDILIGGMPLKKQKDYISANLTVYPNGCDIAFCDRNHHVVKMEQSVFNSDKI